MTRKSKAIGAVQRFLSDTWAMRPDLYLLVATLFAFQLMTFAYFGFELGVMTEAEATELADVIPFLFWALVALPFGVAILAGLARFVSRKAGYPDVFRGPFVRRSEHEAALEELRDEMRAEVLEALRYEEERQEILADGGGDA